MGACRVGCAWHWWKVGLPDCEGARADVPFDTVIVARAPSLLYLTAALVGLGGREGAGPSPARPSRRSCTHQGTVGSCRATGLATAALALIGLSFTGRRGGASQPHTAPREPQRQGVRYSAVQRRTAVYRRSRSSQRTTTTQEYTPGECVLGTPGLSTPAGCLATIVMNAQYCPKTQSLVNEHVAIPAIPAWCNVS